MGAYPLQRATNLPVPHTHFKTVFCFILFFVLFCFSLFFLFFCFYLAGGFCFLHSPIEYDSFLKQIYLTLTVNTTPGQSRPRNNPNEAVLHTSKNSRTEASPSDLVLYHTQDTPLQWIMPACPTGWNRLCFYLFIVSSLVWLIHLGYMVPGQKKISVLTYLFRLHGTRSKRLLVWLICLGYMVPGQKRPLVWHIFKALDNFIQAW